jgi:hypothetical protein
MEASFFLEIYDWWPYLSFQSVNHDDPWYGRRREGEEEKNVVLASVQ